LRLAKWPPFSIRRNLEGCDEVSEETRTSDGEYHSCSGHTALDRCTSNQIALLFYYA